MKKREIGFVALVCALSMIGYYASSMYSDQSTGAVTPGSVTTTVKSLLDESPDTEEWVETDASDTNTTETDIFCQYPEIVTAEYLPVSYYNVIHTDSDDEESVVPITEVTKEVTKPETEVTTTAKPSVSTEKTTVTTTTVVTTTKAVTTTTSQKVTTTTSPVTEAPVVTSASTTQSSQVTTTTQPVTTTATVTTTPVVDQGGLLTIDDPDYSYGKKIIEITGDERGLLERLVMGEAGDQGFIGAALVAQCIKDAMTYCGYTSVQQVITKMQYSGSTSRTPNKNVLDAVAYVFDEGGYAVRHPILYFYAYTSHYSSWHETQELIVQYKDHRFFWRK